MTGKSRELTEIQKENKVNIAYVQKKIWKGDKQKKLRCTCIKNYD